MGNPKVAIIPESIQLLRISDEEYFSDKYKDYISNSKLKLINPEEGGSAELFLQGIKSSYSESFELGSAVHEMLLQPDSFFIHPLRKTSGKLGIFAEKVLANRKLGLTIEESIKKASIQADYYANKLSAARLKTAIKGSLGYYLGRLHDDDIYASIPIYLSESMSTKYEACMGEIERSKNFKKYLHPEGIIENPESYNEYAILCEIKVETDEFSTIIKFKAKLDNFTIDFENNVVTLNDLKTTGKPVKYFMGNLVTQEDGEDIWYPGSFQKFHYHRQMGAYLWMLQCYIMKTHGIVMESRANMLVVETVPDFKCQVFPVSNARIKSGLEEMKKLLLLVAELEWTKQK